MQDPAATFQQIKPQFPEHEQLKCPRCESSNTKFCYYNNYNLSQPRHFCKNCRRYWTKGGTLRNIPVGGGSRKNSKRSSGNSSKRQANSKPDPEPEPTRVRVSADSSPSSRQSEEPALVSGVKDPTRILMGDQDRKMLDFGGSFSSMLATNGQPGNLLEGLNPDGSGLKRTQMGGFGGEMESGQDPDGEPGMEERNYLGGGDSSCWSGSGNGWPDLAIYTPGSSFQ